MAIDLQNGYRGLREHVGHEIVCVKYGEVSVSVECETCGEVLVHFDNRSYEESLHN